MPPKFEHYASLLQPTSGLQVLPGEEAVIPIAFVWDVPDSTPPLLAVCRASFSVRYDASFGLSTEEVTFVVASRENAQALIVKSFDIATANKALAPLNKFLRETEGIKSAGVSRLSSEFQELFKESYSR